MPESLESSRNGALKFKSFCWTYTCWRYSPFVETFSLHQYQRKEEELYLSDIIINLNKIKNKGLKKNFKIEFDRLWVHGLVHLFGYDHKKEKDYLIMHDVEKEYMNMINGWEIFK